MIFKYFLVTIVGIVFIPYSICTKFNISLTNLASCQEYNIKAGGYTYADFFQLHKMENNKIKDNERIHLKFYVMTSMDAHILLSEVNHPTKFDRVYEIVFGAGANSFSAIRLMMSRRRVVTALAPDLLSVFEPMPVEIIQTNDGLLLVNIPNFSEPHLNYTDENPLNISYVSFSSYGMIQAKWFYDCEFDGFTGEMDLETRPISNEERLAADILNVSEPELPPPNVTEIAFSFKVRSVEFNQRSSLLSTRLHLLMNWNDSRLRWNSSEYGNVKSIVQPLFKLWHPVLSVEDGALDTFKEFSPFYSIRVDSDGHVTMFARNAEINSWCFDVTENWPNDVTNCEIILETKGQNIKLAYDTTSPLTDKSINELSEWSIERIAVKYVTFENEINKTDDRNTTRAHLNAIEDDLKIQLTIRRNSAFYHCVFTAPVLVAELLILLSFFLEKYRRGGLNLVAIVVLSLAFMFIAKHAPAIIVPDIVTVYVRLMQIATATYIIHIMSIWLEMYPPKPKPHPYIVSVINCSVLRFVLAMKFEDSTAFRNAEEYPWLEVSKILNRLIFIAIIITFFCINCWI